MKKLVLELSDQQFENLVRGLFYGSGCPVEIQNNANSSDGAFCVENGDCHECWRVELKKCLEEGG